MIGTVDEQAFRFTGFTDRLLPGQPAWLQSLLVLGITMAGAIVLHWLLFRLLKGLARGSDSASDNILVARLERPTRWAVVALVIVVVARTLPILESVWERVAGFVLPALIGWLALAIMRGSRTVPAVPAPPGGHDAARVAVLALPPGRRRPAVSTVPAPAGANVRGLPALANAPGVW